MKWLRHNGLTETTRTVNKSGQVITATVPTITGNRTVTLNETSLTDRTNRLVRYHNNNVNNDRQSSDGFTAAEELGNNNGGGSGGTNIALISYREVSIPAFYSSIDRPASASYIYDGSADFPIRNLILRGKRQGLHHFYQANSNKLVSKGYYIDHRHHGLWHYYDEQARLARTDNFESGGLLWSVVYHDSCRSVETHGTDPLAVHHQLVSTELPTSSQLSATTLIIYHDDGTETRQRYGRESQLEYQANYKSKIVAGRPVVSLYSRDGQRHGPYEEWSEHRQLRFRGHYIDGQRHGAWSEFYGSTGQLKSVKSYIAGVITGPYREYHFNGDLAVTGQHLNKERDGLWFWYRPGNVAEKQRSYKEGVLDGDYADFDEQGQLVEIGVYKNREKVISG